MAASVFLCAQQQRAQFQNRIATKSGIAFERRQTLARVEQETIIVAEVFRHREWRLEATTT